MGVRYALVTGGSRGIGSAVCMKLAQMGIPVIVVFQSNEAAAAKVCEAIAGIGGDASCLKFDVSNREDVEKALGSWEESHPDDYIAYLVNNAGVTRDNLMFMMTDEDWNSQLL